jgi:hypothetical protein
MAIILPALPTSTLACEQVETISESYMVSCGVPVVTEFHGEYIGDVALDMLATVVKIDYPPIGGKKVQVKIGMSSEHVGTHPPTIYQALTPARASALSSASARHVSVYSVTPSIAHRDLRVITKWLF